MVDSIAAYDGNMAVITKIYYIHKSYTKKTAEHNKIKVKTYVKNNKLKACYNK